MGHVEGSVRADLEATELRLIRSALSESADMFGLRRTAREMKMSPSGLRGLIEGTAPYTKTIRRARAWYAEWSRRHGSLDVADEVAIRVLVSTLPESQQPAAGAQIAALMGMLRRGEIA